MSTSTDIVHVPDVAVKDVAASNNLIQWIFERVKTFITGRVLELSGPAELMGFYCLECNASIEVKTINIDHDLSEVEYTGLSDTYDTVIALHALQQERNYLQTILNCAKIIKTDGYLIIRLPACTALYNGLDQGFRKWKYYNMQFMNSLLCPHFRIIKTRYFMVENSQLLDHKGISKYRERVVLFKNGNAPGFDDAGLSAIVVAQKR